MHRQQAIGHLITVIAGVIAVTTAFTSPRTWWIYLVCAAAVAGYWTLGRKLVPADSKPAISYRDVRDAKRTNQAASGVTENYRRQGGL